MSRPYIETRASGAHTLSYEKITRFITIRSTLQKPTHIGSAATTLFEAKTKGKPDRFNADHPFLFLIRDRASGTILFLGRLADPRA